MIKAGLAVGVAGRGDKKKKIVEPFDLTIKTRNDEITLFDLKQESRFMASPQGMENQGAMQS